MKKILHLVVSLTLISAVCAAVLAVVNDITKARIASLQTLKANNAAKAVLPAGVKAFDTKPDPANAALTVLVAYSDDAKTQVAGYAVPGVNGNGYGGEIRLMVGLTPERKVFSYRVLAANETPGLGAKLGDAEFAKQFAGKAGASLAVKKDGGDIEAITGATITSRAVCGAIADAVARVDRLEGKAASPLAAANGRAASPLAAAGDGRAASPLAAANPEGTLLFDPADPKEALKALPKGTVTATPLSQDRFPIFEGKDANGQTTGFALVGTGKAQGPNGDLILHMQYSAGPKRTLAFNPPPRAVNKPGIEMTDMEAAQRKAFNLAMQDAASKLKNLAR